MATSNALAGLNAAATQLEASGRRVSRMLPQALGQADASGVAGGAGAPEDLEPPVDLAREFTDQAVALVQGKASIRVMETELELRGP
ncbi:MAG: hypothetical protein V3T14_11535 [Myxococcota bacterium]